MNNVAGLVVLYNPPKDILSNIESYLYQINYLFIIDNTGNDNSELRKKIDSYKNIEYLSLSNNLGIAKALNIGAFKAINKGYDFLLTMDQDSVASPDIISKLMNVFDEYKNAGIVAPFPVNKIYNLMPRDNLVHNVNKVITSGSLLKLEAFQTTGPFREDLFIDYVDFEYCFRLQKKGYSIYINNNAIIYHSVGKLIKWKMLGTTFYSTNHDAIRMFYRTRNRLYIKSLYEKDFPEFFRNDLNNFIKETLKILLVEKNKLAKLKMIILGYFHYKKRKLGKFEPD